MQIFPFRPEVAERILAGTGGETIHRNSAFVQTASSCWPTWHDGIAALFAPDNPPDTPCFRVEGAQNLAELVALIENNGFDEVEESDGDDDSWYEVAADCSGYGHDDHCGCGR